MEKLKILYLSSWPPHHCGVATFASDMAGAIGKISPEVHWRVIAAVPSRENYRYPKEVIKQIRRDYLEDYEEAANFCNQSPFNLVVVQHEFGLYGGGFGKYLLNFLKKLKKPSIGIMHSLPTTEDKIKNIRKLVTLLKKICPFFQKLVTTCSIGKKRLEKIYMVPSSKIDIIPHGSISFPRISSSKVKKKLGLENNILILSFGFVSPIKHDVLLTAFSQVVPQCPESRLVILGSIHVPKAKIYLNQLNKLIRILGIDKEVILFNKFVSTSLIKSYYKAADVYVAPNPYKTQISSGPLTFALGAGKAIVSTSFDYARDMLKNDRGVLVPSGDSTAIAKAILTIIKNPSFKKKLEKKSSSFGKNLIWDKIAFKYIQLFKEVYHQR